MRSKTYGWLMRDVIPYWRATTYYSKPENGKYPKWGALAREGYKHLKPGHIILTRDKKKLTTAMVGFLGKVTAEAKQSDFVPTHAAFCLFKDSNYEIAEMTHTDFTKSTWFDVCYESTRVVILECPHFDENYIEAMRELSTQYEQTKYDDLFEFGVESLYCSELVYALDFERRLALDIKPILGNRDYISPVGIYLCKNLRIVWDSNESYS